MVVWFQCSFSAPLIVRPASWEAFMKTAKRGERQQFLSGWKEIADYLSKGVRTVQRYEREMGLPVRRPAGRTTGSVLATKAELDAWVTASPIREAFHLTKKKESETSSMRDSIRSGVAEMVKLREQMMALRNEVRTSVELLHQGLKGLEGDLAQNDLRAKLRGVTVLEPQQRNSYLLDLLAKDARWKAS